MTTQLFSEAESETLKNLIANRVKAAACDKQTPAERTHLVLFNPATRQFGSWLIPNAEPGSLLPNEPTDIKRLKAAGFVVLCEIPEYKTEAEPALSGVPPKGSWVRRGVDGLELCEKTEAGWRKLRTPREVQAEADAEATMQALLVGMTPSNHKRFARSATC